MLVCPAEEFDHHRALGRPAWLCPVEGIVRKRQWILDNTGHECIAMLDDDLIFLKRKDPSAWNLKRCEPSEIEDLFSWVEALSFRYPQVGVSPRQGNNRFFPAELAFCNRVTNFHVYDVPVLRKLGVRFHDKSFPETFTMEDFHVSLSLLEAGYQNAIVTNWAWDQHGSNSKGGCSLYRNSDTQRVSAELLAKRHPGLVRVVAKATKGGWAGVSTNAAGGGIRTDVVISWKKAYELGSLKRAA